MEVVDLKLKGLQLIKPRKFGDERGWFVETWRSDRYPNQFLQDNASFSAKGVLRGLHIQDPAQGKLVQCLCGCVFDVAVDVRASSETYGQWVGVELSEDNAHQLWVPPGFAHGFYAMKDSLIQYKCTEYYCADTQMTLRWDDPTVGVEWPISRTLTNPRLAEKDWQGKSLCWFGAAKLPVKNLL